MAKKRTRTADDISVRQLIDCIPDLIVTERQREFIRAAFRACLVAALQKKFKCRVDI